LNGVVQREKAQIGVLITLENPTKAMVTEAASSGFYKSSWGNHPSLQILTIEDLLGSKPINCPPTAAFNTAFKNAKPVKMPNTDELELDFPGENST